METDILATIQEHSTEAVCMAAGSLLSILFGRIRARIAARRAKRREAKR